LDAAADFAERFKTLFSKAARPSEKPENANDSLPVNQQCNKNRKDNFIFTALHFTIHLVYSLHIIDVMKPLSCALTIVAFSLFLLKKTEAQPTVVITNYASGFTRPVKIASAGDSRLFIAEIGGKIKIVKSGVVSPDPFLDISALISNPEWSGIQSIAFAPNYLSTGFFYVMYVIKNSTNVQLSRFSRSSNNVDKADVNSEVKILTIPYEDVLGGHIGGDLAFGKDDQLYISTGDNGPGSRGAIGDDKNNAQNNQKLFGKILRLDITSASPGDHILSKIFALGLRNPWRFGFDRSLGDLWIGDNGQDGWEEVNYLKYPFAGAVSNFGWSCMEGNAVYTTSHCAPGTTYISASHIYPGYNNNGTQSSASVIGGYVYRGSRYASLKGYYFFGDYAAGKIGVVNPSGTGSFLTGLSLPSIVSFGEDNAGELYAISFLEGTLSKITGTDAPLPVNLEYLSLTKESCNAKIEWKTTLETNFSHFELERSTDAKTFYKIASLPASGTNHIYTFLDERPISGNNFYRLKMLDNDGSYQYSRMDSIKSSCRQGEITVFPNPGEDKFVIDGVAKGQKIRIYTSSGKLIISKIASGNNTELNLQNYPSGVYGLSIEDSGTGFVKKSTLVKK
jgi:glucose/arabinose dehydrogenase